MEQGATESFIVKQCFQQNLPLPDTILNAPILFQGLELYYLGFKDLTTCRSQGYGSEGPINYMMIHDYCKIYEIEGEQREDFFFHLGALDQVYLKYKAKKLKDSAKR